MVNLGSKTSVQADVWQYQQGNGCFVALKRLKMWWIKAGHVLSVHYPGRKTLRPKAGLKRLSFCLFVQCKDVKRKSLNIFLAQRSRGEKNVSSIIEVRHVQFISTLQDYYFIRGDVTLLTAPNQKKKKNPTQQSLDGKAQIFTQTQIRNGIKQIQTRWNDKNTAFEVCH